MKVINMLLEHRSFEKLDDDYYRSEKIKVKSSMTRILENMKDLYR